MSKLIDDDALIELIENKKKSCDSITESVTVFPRSTTKKIKRR